MEITSKWYSSKHVYKDTLKKLYFKKYCEHVDSLQITKKQTYFFCHVLVGFVAIYKDTQIHIQLQKDKYLHTD